MANIVTYTPLVIAELLSTDIGRPVSHRQYTDHEYGIVTDFNTQFVFVHFNNGDKSQMLTPKHLYLTKIEEQ